MTTPSQAFLILDIADWIAGSWPGLRCYGGESANRIPQDKQPTVIQGNRKVAEQELLRLAAAHPTGTFVLFTTTHMATPVEVTTHVSLSGRPMSTAKTYRLSTIDDVPF
jgi:hypothetical protein